MLIGSGKNVGLLWSAIWSFSSGFSELMEGEDVHLRQMRLRRGT